MERWLRTDEAQEAVSALELAVRHLGSVPSDIFAWRWVVISLHIATQGFMVIALRDSAGLIPLPDELAERWLHAYRRHRPLPSARLDSFPKLYKKVQLERTAAQLGATPFKPVGSQGRSITLLNSLRNQFIHFLPMSWSLEVSGLPAVCLDVLGFIGFLVHEYRPLVWHEEQHPRRVAIALNSARNLLVPLHRHNEESA